MPGQDAAAATTARIPLGTLAPDVVRLETEVKQITHAIRVTAYNAETPWPAPRIAPTPEPAMRPTP